MREKKPLLDHPFFVIFASLSVCSVAVLWGGYRYVGTLLPATDNTTQSEAVAIWGGWLVVVAIPVATVIWLVRYWTRD